MKKALLIFLILFAGSLKVSALTAGNFSVTRTSAPYFDLDSNTPMTAGPHASYIAIKVSNISGSTINNLRLTVSTVTANSPSNCTYTLYEPSDSSFVIGSLAAGGYKICYYFVGWNALVNTNAAFGNNYCTIAFSLNDYGGSSALSYSFNWNNRKSISAQAGGTVINVTGNQNIIGGIFTDTLTYSVGNAQTGDEVDFEIALNNNLDANKLFLIGTRVYQSGEPGIHVGSTDSLYFHINAPGGSVGATVKVIWTFKIKGVNFSTTLSPFCGTTSGGSNYKYTYDAINGNYTVTISSNANKLTLSKSADASTYYKNGTVTYTVTLNNTSTLYAMTVDKVTDVLPSGYKYQAIASGSDITATNSASLPAVNATGTINFIGGNTAASTTSYYIAANSTIYLKYTAKAANSITVSDTNKAKPYIMTTLLGTAYCVTHTIPFVRGAIAGSQTFCGTSDPAAFTSTLAAAGLPTVIYQWQSSSNNTSFSDIGGATSITYDAPSTSATTYFRRKDTDGNSDFGYTDTIVVTINPIPAATISYSGSPYCQTGQTGSVTQTGQAGGTYTSTAGLSINAATGAINVNASTAGSYTVTYSFTNGLCSNTTTASVTINALPTASISYSGTPYCATGSASVTQTGQGSGTYSSSAGLSINSSTGAVNLVASTAGTYTVTYSFTNGTCSNTTTTSISINALPTATISYSGTPYCATGTASVTQTGQAGGTYSSTAGLVINSSTGAINLVTSSTGTYTVTYSFTNGTCSNTTTTSITINPIPTATISYPGTPYCASGTASVTQTGQGGGTYTSTAGLVINSATGAINLTTSTSGTYTVTYSFTNGSCASSTTTSITVNSYPVITGQPTLQTTTSGNSVSFTVTATGASTYQWYKGGVLIAGATAATYTINPVAIANAGNYSVTVTGSGGCATNSSSVALTVKAKITGNVFDDLNGYTNSTIDGTGTTCSGTLHAFLINNGGTVQTSMDVASNGRYSFPMLDPGNYTVRISTNSAANGAAAPSVALPVGWVSIGEHIGAGLGNDGSADGIIAITLGASTDSVSQANFGIERNPTATDIAISIAQPLPNSSLQLDGGTHPQPLTATDAEEGTLLNGATFKINDITGMNGNELYYAGVLITAATSISNFDPSQLEVKFSGYGSNSLTFYYTVFDAATKQDPTSRYYIMQWANALPVQLADFSLEEKEDGIAITWETKAELNCKSFVIEQSADAINFETIATIAGNGTSTSNHTYNYMNKKPYSGENYCRICQIDQDGTKHFLETQEILFGDKNTSSAVSLFPNPASASFTIKGSAGVNENITMEIYTITGEKMCTYEETTGNNSQFKLPVLQHSLAPGLYTVILISKEGIKKSTLIIE